MQEKLYLEIQKRKTHIINIKQGVEFLGAFIKPYRTYVSNSSIKRMNRNMRLFQVYDTDKNVSYMVNSYIGAFSHYKSNKIKKKMMDKTSRLKYYGNFLGYYSKFVEN